MSSMRKGTRERPTQTRAMPTTGDAPAPETLARDADPGARRARDRRSGRRSMSWRSATGAGKIFAREERITSGGSELAGGSTVIR